MKKIIASLVIALIVTPLAAKNTSTHLRDELSRTIAAYTDRAPSTALIESGFSPKENSERLILKVINTSAHSIRLAAYSFTSPTIVKGLLAAKKRGVDIQVVVDEKGNKGKASVSALRLLIQADIPVRTVSKYAIHHDKYIVSDGLHVQNGSFNYSMAAASSNSENVIVIWHNEPLALAFLNHWQSRFDQGTPLSIAY